MENNITEQYLYYVWKFQLFNKINLTSTKGERIQIISPGHMNPNAGPDFINAIIEINELLWHGHIEIHTKSKDWYKHKHENDIRYNLVVLHVVWEDNGVVYKSNKEHIPTLVLKNKIFQKHGLYLLKNHPLNKILCSSTLKSIPCHIINNALKSSLKNRLNNKINGVKKVLKLNNYDWEYTAFYILCKTMGLSINSSGFTLLSKKIHSHVLYKCYNNLRKLEALFFGQAGFLNDNSNKGIYFNQLKSEYKYLKVKYPLPQPMNSKLYWNFFRLRPANFPTIRIAQLTSIIYHSGGIFDLLLNKKINEIKKILSIEPSSYWQSHYNFGKKSSIPRNRLGDASINLILINAVAPIRMAYNEYKGSRNSFPIGFDLLYSLKPEVNKITNAWNQTGVLIKNAAISQGALEHFKSYCQEKQCLKCKIGKFILKK